MIKVQNVGERGLFTAPPAPVTIAAATSTELLPNQVVEPKMLEIAYRYIQNTGANPLFYAFASACSATVHHGVLPQYAQLDCSNHRLQVTGFSTGGTTAAVTIIYRNDTGRNNSIIPPA